MRSLLVLPLLLCFSSSAAFSKTLTIGVDVSTSNPLVSSSTFAGVAAKYARDQIANMAMGDVVEIRTIGDRSMANFKTERVQINRRNRADKVGDMVARYIEGLPGKTLEGQGATNLIAFLEFGSFDCANGGKILLLTDGVESSDYISIDQFLSGKPLPKPDANFLVGCDVTMLGFGQNMQGEWPPQVIKHMRSSWSAWMGAAGASFHPIINP